MIGPSSSDYQCFVFLAAKEDVSGPEKTDLAKIEGSLTCTECSIFFARYGGNNRKAVLESSGEEKGSGNWSWRCRFPETHKQ